MHRFLTVVVALAGLILISFPAVGADPGAASAQANQFFDRCFDAQVDRSPVYQSYLGIKKDYDRWDDASDARMTEDLAFNVGQLAELQRTFREENLDASTRISYRLFVGQTQDAIEGFRWRHHNFPVNQMFGVQSEGPAFLINIHRIDDRRDAEAYIARVRGMGKLIDQNIEGLAIRQAKGILPPKFVFSKAIEDCRNLLKGKPFEAAGDDSTLVEDFAKKIGAVKSLDAAVRTELQGKLNAALREEFQPAYQRLISFLETQEKATTGNFGVWNLPDGADFYAHRLRVQTTTRLTPAEIHQIGLDEVARIRSGMQEIMGKVKFEGGLKDFFAYLREDARFYYPETAEGKAAYLKEAVRIVDTMRGRLDDLFLTKPKAPMIVKAVEPFREKSAGGAFYQDPAPDGSRPGIYYANLYKMKDMPKYEMEALAYHEGIPGHHMQLAIAQELQGVPKFRRLGNTGYTAYVEGWGLYCELLPKELGFYQDPYSDFGRLSMEMMRASRLVVDTGIHAMKWTREQAVAFMMENSPMSETDATREVERYFVMPGQATAYKIGMLKLLEQREKARKALGTRFDIRAFHDVVLKNGAVPLDLLEELVDGYIKAKQEG